MASALGINVGAASTCRPLPSAASWPGSAAPWSFRPGGRARHGRRRADPAFVVIVIGGLGSLEGALVGALIVSFVRTAGIQFFPEIELAVLYLIAAAVLLITPDRAVREGLTMQA